MAQHPPTRTNTPAVENDAKRGTKPQRGRRAWCASTCAESAPEVESVVVSVRPTLDARRALRLAEDLRRAEAGDYPIRPVHLRYFRAKTELIDSGKPPTYVNLARSIGISTVALWKFRRRYPWVEPWSDAVLIEQARPLFGAIMRRMGLTALQGGGSPQHAEQYCKMLAGFYDRSLPAGESDVPAGGGAPAMVYNFLIPRPATPVIPGVTVRESTLKDRNCLPTFRRSRCAERRRAAVGSIRSRMIYRQPLLP